MPIFLSDQRKTCFKCKVEKPLSGFYRHPQMADGHLGKCKDCAREDAAAHRAANIDLIRAYDRARGCRTTDAARRERRRLYRKARAANNAVARAVSAGKLVKQPCEVCGSEHRIHAHHEDYEKPLVVMWLCAVHHRARHKELGWGFN